MAAVIIKLLRLNETPMSFDLYVIHMKDGEPAQAEPVELAQALVGDVSAWQGYRDQVVTGSQGSAE